MVSQKVARLAKRERKSARATFRVAVLVGPRQYGKATLAQLFEKGRAIPVARRLCDTRRSSFRSLDGLISMACPVAIFGTLLTTSRQAQRRALRRRPRPPDLRKRDAFPSGPRFPLRASLQRQTKSAAISETRRPRGAAAMDSPPPAGLHGDGPTTMKRRPGAVTESMSMFAQRTDRPTRQPPLSRRRLIVQQETLTITPPVKASPRQIEFSLSPGSAGAIPRGRAPPPPPRSRRRK